MKQASKHLDQMMEENSFHLLHVLLIDRSLMDPNININQALLVAFNNKYLVRFAGLQLHLLASECQQYLSWV